jgi:hypothetical protein
LSSKESRINWKRRTEYNHFVSQKEIHISRRFPFSLSFLEGTVAKIIVTLKYITIIAWFFKEKRSFLLPFYFRKEEKKKETSGVLWMGAFGNDLRLASDTTHKRPKAFQKARLSSSNGPVTP